MRVKRKIIEIDEDRCTGCGLCVPSCAEGAIRIEDGKARLLAEKYCDGLGACLGDCPEDALRIIDREADEFDEEAVEELLKSMPQEDPATSSPAGCPSAKFQTFAPGATPAATAPNPILIRTGMPTDTGSQLTHWPVQIRLVAPDAPFLRDADLLVAADCVPAAYAGFHEEFLKGRVVMLGCPKFDDAQLYVDRFTEIFRSAGVRSVTIVRMEVPCCGGLPAIVKKAWDAAGASVPLENVVIGTQGDIVSRTAV